ncbi:CLUMA_CG013407, isoform A [Clunio marinus]|uniref:CLUMA_CG013407, isoform A n=1 Tax=Clunio marinus TaxID=568069 RepID=A0A1J1IIQ7_9DIPT|nr:CLUMA_CG013407, isoform A [Clunio marinus]
MKMQWVEVDYDKPKPSLKNVKAKALYDNIAETVDELAFRKGEILDVIEQNTDGLDGWWLCSLRGRKGICPGNRLKVIDYETACYTPSPLTSPCSTSMSMSASTLTFSSQISQPSELYENTSIRSSKGKRRSWHIMPNKVVTPQKCGDVYLYDLLPSTPSSCSSFAVSRLNSPGPYMNQSMVSSLSFDADSYDIPKPAVAVNENPRIRRGFSRQSILSNSSTATSLLLRMDDSYDVPRPASNLGNSRMTPSSSNSSLLTSDSLSLSLSSSNRSSLANMPDYDVPRKHISAMNKRTPPPQSQSILSLKSIDLGSETYDVPNSHANMNSPKRFETTKELPLELSSALDTLSRLQHEATVGVTKLLSFVNPQWRVKVKLEPVLMDIKLAVVRLKTSLHDLAEFAEGALGNAMKTEDKNLSNKLRPLAKALKDADKLIHEACNALDLQSWNIELLKRTESNMKVKSKQSQLPPDSLDQLIVVSQTLTEDIRQTASFIQGNASLLFKRNSQTPSTPVSQVQWPEDTDYFFLAYGKFVVLSAHNLVNIGDIVHRNVTKKNIKTRILSCANALFESLKTCVTKTKKAAQNFPSVTAVQEMVDSVVDISHLASELKITMLQAINP